MQFRRYSAVNYYNLLLLLTLSQVAFADAEAVHFSEGQRNRPGAMSEEAYILSSPTKFHEMSERLEGSDWQMLAESALGKVPAWYCENGKPLVNLRALYWQKFDALDAGSKARWIETREGAAKKELDAALATSNDLLKDLDSIANRYRPTPSGQKALLRLMAQLADGGQPMAASYYFAGYWQTAHADVSACREPALSYAAIAAIKFLAAGSKQLHHDVVKELKHCTTPIRVAGKQIESDEWHAMVEHPARKHSDPLLEFLPIPTFSRQDNMSVVPPNYQTREWVIRALRFSNSMDDFLTQLEGKESKVPTGKAWCLLVDSVGTNADVDNLLLDFLEPNYPTLFLATALELKKQNRTFSYSNSAERRALDNRLIPSLIGLAAMTGYYFKVAATQGAEWRREVALALLPVWFEDPIAVDLTWLREANPELLPLLTRKLKSFARLEGEQQKRRPFDINEAEYLVEELLTLAKQEDVFAVLEDLLLNSEHELPAALEAYLLHLFTGAGHKSPAISRFIDANYPLRDWLRKGDLGEVGMHAIAYKLGGKRSRASALAALQDHLSAVVAMNRNAPLRPYANIPPISRLADSLAKYLDDARTDNMEGLVKALARHGDTNQVAAGARAILRNPNVGASHTTDGAKSLGMSEAEIQDEFVKILNEAADSERKERAVENIVYELSFSSKPPTDELFDAIFKISKKTRAIYPVYDYKAIRALGTLTLSPEQLDLALPHLRTLALDGKNKEPQSRAIYALTARPEPNCYSKQLLLDAIKSDLTHLGAYYAAVAVARQGWLEESLELLNDPKTRFSATYALQLMAKQNPQMKNSILKALQKSENAAVKAALQNALNGSLHLEPSGTKIQFNWMKLQSD